MPPALTPARRRVGVLGGGPWVRLCVGPALAAHPEVELVGFWARRPAAAAEVAAEVGTGRVFEDVDDLLDAVDVVAIALPPAVQPAYARRAADRGRHLLLDKPLALDPAEAEQVVAAVDRAGVRSVVFFTYCFDAQVQAWIRDLRALADQHGPWEGAIVSCAGAVADPSSPYVGSAWRRDRGGLWDLGPHAISLVQELLPPVQRVHATRGVRDTVNLVLEHPGRVSSYVTVTITAPPAAGGSWMTVWGPAGRFSRELMVDSVSAYGRAVDELLRAIDEGSSAAVDARYAADVVATLHRAELAAGPA